MEEMVTRVKKSETLTEEEKLALVSWVNDQPTKIDAAETLGMHRVTMDRIMLAGSGSPDNIAKVRRVLSENQKA